MTYEHDPELPFLVLEVNRLTARFRTEEDASYWVHKVIGAGDVIDTTPKPKIPDNAKFLYWRDKDVQPYYAREVNGDWETDEAELLSPDELTRFIGDCDVTVLIPREES